MNKLALLVAALFVLGGVAAWSAPAQARGCKSCQSCSCKAKFKGGDCTCAPHFCPAGSVGGFHTDCVDGCCPPKAGTDEVCVGDWDVCMKWADGLIHHPYELAHSGSAMLCDTGCGAYIPCKRRGVQCRTLCKEHTCTDNCGCKHVSYSAETICDEIARPRTVPWWFTPGRGNVYLDADGKPICAPAVEPEPAQPEPPRVTRPEPLPEPPPQPDPPPAVTTEPEPEPEPEIVEINGRG